MELGTTKDIGTLTVIKAWKTGQTIFVLLDNGVLYKSRAKRVKVRKDVRK